MKNQNLSKEESNWLDQLCDCAASKGMDSFADSVDFEEFRGYFERDYDPCHALELYIDL